MSGAAQRNLGYPSFDEFLAQDFARLDPGLLDRCGKIDGKRLYLTGPTGFFGKNLLALLAYLGSRGASFAVTALSRNPQRFLAAEPWCQALPWLEWQTGDARTPWPGEGHFDLLLHAATDTAATAHVDKLEVFQGILAATRQAVQFAANHGVHRLLLTGSGAQYGEIPEQFASGIPESSSLACHPCSAASAYGEAKRAGELLGTLHGERQGFAAVNTRCFAFVGPGLALDGHFAIGNFLRDALLGGPIRMASSGTAVRSYLYGADLAVWLMVLLLEWRGGGAVNVGSDQAISVVDLARRVRDRVHPGSEVRVGDAKPGKGRHIYLPSIEAARRIGLEVWTDLNAAIERTALWHRGRQEWR